MPVYFAGAEVRAVEKHLELCRSLDLRVTSFMYNGRWTVSFLPPGRCRTGARDYQHDYQQKTKQRAHVYHRRVRDIRLCRVNAQSFPDNFYFLTLTFYFPSTYFFCFVPAPDSSTFSSISSSAGTV